MGSPPSGQPSGGHGFVNGVPTNYNPSGCPSGGDAVLFNDDFPLGIQIGFGIDPDCLDHGGGGDVVGPASSTDGDFAQFDGIDGKLLKDGGYSPASFDAAGTAAAAVAAHEAALDPHPQYLTPAEGDAAYINEGQAAGGDLTGTYPSPTLTAIGSATGPIGDGTHVSRVTIDAKGRVTALTSVLITGTSPTGAAGGDLSGTYPNPDIAAGVIVNADVNAAAGIVESKLALNFPTHTAANDPSSGEKAALAGTSGTPGSGNKYVTDADARNTNSRAPNGPAGGDLAGIYPSPTLAVIGSATGPLGDGTHVARVTIDAKGRVTALSSVAISDYVGATVTDDGIPGFVPAATASTGLYQLLNGDGAWRDLTDVIDLSLFDSLGGDPSTTAAGDIIFRGDDDWLRLAAGDDGQVLRATGALSAPVWEDLNQGLRRITVITATGAGTYVPPTSGVNVMAVLIGAGGGGGGAAQAASSSSAGGGGGAGSVLIKLLRNVNILGVAYNVGALGAGGAAGNNAGAAGGNTTLTSGVTNTAPGGSGGAGAPASLVARSGGIGGTGGTTPTNGTVNVVGGNGGPGLILGPGTIGGAIGGAGGSNQYAAGGLSPVVEGVGVAGIGLGAGGSGAVCTGTTARAGGAGTNGAIILFEYYA